MQAVNQFEFQRIHVICAVTPAKPITYGPSLERYRFD